MEEGERGGREREENYDEGWEGIKTAVPVGRGEEVASKSCVVGR